MVSLFKLLVYNSTFLNDLFSKDEYRNHYEVIFSKENAFEFYESQFENEIKFLILDETFATEEKIDIIKKISIPVIVISKNLTQEQKILLLSTSIDDIITDCDDSKVLIKKLDNIIKKFKTFNAKIKNIKEKFEKEASINESIDAKSGLLTQEAFKEAALELIQRNTQTKYVILQLDLDKFKVFNEMFGFKSGDKLLEIIGKNINEMLQYDEIAGRIRADHFILCLNNNNIIAPNIASEIEKQLSKYYPGFYFIVRIGLCKVEPKESLDIERYLSRSLIALLSVKNDIKNNFAYFQEEMSKRLKDEQELISQMVGALHDKEFTIFLQPQYDYPSDTLVGAEALVRWIHPKRGLIPPDKFIPIFEKNGFITQLDEFVWEQACILVRRWLDKGLNPVPVSVNISRRDIYNINLITHFDNLLEKYKLSTNLLRLEITESAYMENPVQLIKVVTQLRERGFTVEMDDFGSGYSSLNTLKEIPLDILKLDMKFIMNQNKNSTESETSVRSGSILGSVVRMANWLELPVIAEGIETKEQADYLKSIGCFQMQGYYFARPMPAEQYEELLLNLPLVEKINETQKLESRLQKKDFLDSSIQTTTIFNTFLGGSAIIEWTGKSIEVIRVNDAFFDELKIQRKDYVKVQKNIINRLEEKSRSVFLSNLAEASRTGKSVSCELQTLPFYENSTPQWLNVKITHLSETPTSEVFFISIDNITFRLQMLEINTNLAEQLSFIMDRIPCGITTINYNKKFKISYINETFSEILKYPPTEFRDLLEKNLFFYVDDSSYLKDIKNLKKIVKGQKSIFTENTTGFCKDGTKLELFIKGSLLLNDDNSYSITMIVADVNSKN